MYAKEKRAKGLGPLIYGYATARTNLVSYNISNYLTVSLLWLVGGVWSYPSFPVRLTADSHWNNQLCCFMFLRSYQRCMTQSAVRTSDKYSLLFVYVLRYCLRTITKICSIADVCFIQDKYDSLDHGVVCRKVLYRVNTKELLTFKMIQKTNATYFVILEV